MSGFSLFVSDFYCYISFFACHHHTLDIFHLSKFASYLVVCGFFCLSVSPYSVFLLSLLFTLSVCLTFFFIYVILCHSFSFCNYLSFYLSLSLTASLSLFVTVYLSILLVLVCLSFFQCHCLLLFIYVSRLTTCLSNSLGHCLTFCFSWTVFASLHLLVTA